MDTRIPIPFHPTVWLVCVNPLVVALPVCVFNPTEGCESGIILPSGDGPVPPVKPREPFTLGKKKRETKREIYWKINQSDQLQKTVASWWVSLVPKDVGNQMFPVLQPAAGLHPRALQHGGPSFAKNLWDHRPRRHPWREELRGICAPPPGGFPKGKRTKGPKSLDGWLEKVKRKSASDLKPRLVLPCAS